MRWMTPGAIASCSTIAGNVVSCRGGTTRHLACGWSKPRFNRIGVESCDVDRRLAVNGLDV